MEGPCPEYGRCRNGQHAGIRCYPDTHMLCREDGNAGRAESYFFRLFWPLVSSWDKADPATLFVALLVRLSRKSFDALDDTLLDVSFFAI